MLTGPGLVRLLPGVSPTEIEQALKGNVRPKRQKRAGETMVQVHTQVRVTYEVIGSNCRPGVSLERPWNLTKKCLVALEVQRSPVPDTVALCSSAPNLGRCHEKAAREKCNFFSQVILLTKT